MVWGKRFVVFSAEIALSHRGRTITPCSFAVLAVPCPTLWRSVPCRSKVTITGESLQVFWPLSSLAALLCMSCGVLFFCDADEIVDVVVKRVTIDVMNVAALGDWAMY